MELLEVMAIVSAAREEGRQAAHAGKHRKQNPYSPFEDELKAAGWDDGYCRAVEDIRKKGAL